MKDIIANMAKRISATACLGLAVAVVLSSGSVAGEKKLVIGMAVREITNDFNRTIIEGGRKVVEENGGELVVTDGNADIRKHIDNISNLITKQVDGVIVQLGEPSQLVSVFEKAKAAGIPVSSTSVGQRTPGCITDVNGDEELSGMLLGRQLLNDLNAKGRVFMISVPGAPVLEKRLRVFRALLAGYENIWLSDVYPTQHSVTDTLNVMQNILTANPNKEDIAAVFVTYDLLASGAVQAIKNAGREKDIKVYSIDGDKIAFQMMFEEDNPFVATVSQDTYGVGVLAAQALMDVIHGKDPETIPAALYPDDTLLASNTNIKKAVEVARRKWGENCLEEWEIDEAELLDRYGEK
ncbi:MAG: substrate-binding domain-containing protein [Planctomycetota bacterium]|jgi:ABC-type sugar transport system substrate-binding protein|nr:substrate-binding domain-containing protein [Planctomycetota bacterium]